jgi:hypothetical protein
MDRQCLALTHRPGVLFLAFALQPVGLDPGLDALLGLQIIELLLTLFRGLLDLLLALELLLGVFGLLGRLFADLLQEGECMSIYGTWGRTSFRLASSFSWADWPALFSFNFWRSSSSLAFFSSSVSGAISSVDSEKSV